MKTARIYTFGDSQTYGAWDSQGGWCDRLRQRMHAMTLDESLGVKYQMFNLGIGGEHSRALRARIKNELDARHRPDWPPIIIIATGENDTRYVEGGKPIVPLEEYRANMEAAIAIAREYTGRILLVGLTLTKHETQSFKTTTFSHDLLRQYDGALTEIAAKEQLPKVDAIEALAAEHNEVFYKDGVHLNDRGHELLSNAIWVKLSAMLED